MAYVSLRLVCLSTLVLTLALPFGMAAAQQAEPSSITSSWQARKAVSDAALQQVRGGFTGVDGSLQFSFGIEHSVYLDGNLAGQLPQGVGAGAGLLLVQHGEGNSSLASAGVLVQNSVDQQHLKTLTVLDVSVNSVALTRSLELQRSVAGAIEASLRR